MKFFRIIIAILTVMAGFLVGGTAAQAKLTEPDVIFYGTATQSPAGSVISVRLNSDTGPLMATTLDSGKNYVLRLPMDSVGTRTAGKARTGDTVSFFAGQVFIGKMTVPDRGSLVNIDLGPGFGLELWQQGHPGDTGIGDLNRNGITDFQEFINDQDPAACVWTVIDATHAEATVYSEKVLANCLKDAESDGRHNVIRMAQGTYYGTFSHTPSAGENFNLTLTGGYDPAGTPEAPGLRSSGPNLTILSGDTDMVKDGIGNGRVLLIDGVTGSVTATVHLEGVQIRDGKVTGGEKGAGIRAMLYKGKLELIDNILNGNVTDGNGGGLAFETSDVGELLLAGNILYANRAALGAAVHGSTTVGTVTLLNNTIADNQATTAGDGQVVLVESTGATVDITNNILSGTNGATGAELYINTMGMSSIPYYLRYNLLDKWTQTVTAYGFSLAPNNLKQAPAFVDPPMGNYHLQVSSPAINKGYSSHAKLPATDLDGEKRILGSAVDIGADEVDLSVLNPNPSNITLNGFVELTNTLVYTVTGTVTDSNTVRSLTIANPGNPAFTQATPFVAADGSFSADVSLVEGANTLTFSAVDQIGYITNVTKSITLDTIKPTAAMTTLLPNPTNSATIPVTVTFSEPVTGFDAGKLAVTNGSVSGFSGSGANYGFSVIPTGQSTVTVDIVGSVATDAAGNPNTAAPQLARTHDSVVPAPVLGSTAPINSNVLPLPVTATFSESVTGFDATDLAVINGTILAGSFAGSGANYSFKVVPTGQGTVTVTVAASAATDATGNLSAASPPLTRTYDSIAPSVVLTSTAVNPTSSAPIAVTVTFSESVTGFDTSDLALINGTVSPGSFSGSNATYSFSIVPNGQGEVTVNVAAGAATDTAGNLSAAAPPLTRTYDSIAPSVVLTSTAANPTNSASIPVIVTFSESVTGFDTSDLALTNGTVSPGSFSGSNATYSFSIVPNGQGEVTVNVAAGAATDTAGNLSIIAQQLKGTYDSTSPGVTLASTATPMTKSMSIPVTVTFTEPVSGFNADDLKVTNGSVRDFLVSDARNYSFILVPAEQGAVMVDLASGAALDAAGNPSPAATQLVRIYDSIAPSVMLTSTAANPTNSAPIPVTVTFSESVTGFDTSDLVLTNGTVMPGSFTGGGDTYSFSIVPVGQGAVTVDVAAGAATDSAGNSSTAAVQLSRNFHSISPAVVLASTAPANTSVSPIPVTVTFSSPVTGFDATDLVVANGTVSGINGSDALYSFNLTPLGQGAVTVDIAAGAATDAAGNTSTAATQLIRIYDTLAPILKVSTLADKSYTHNETLNIGGAFTDAGGFLSLTVNGDPVVVNPDGSFSHVRTLAPGANTIAVTAIDLADNPVSDTRVITLDKTAPVITVTAPVDNIKTARTFLDVSGNVDENAVVTVKVNGGDPQTAAMKGNEFGVTVDLIAGLNTIDITAVDQAGNPSSAKRTATSDQDKPTLAIIDPAQDITTSLAGLTLKGTVGDALSTVTVSIAMDGATFTPDVVDGAFAQKLTFGDEKSYQITVSTTDEAGNTISVQRNIVYSRGSIIINKGAEYAASTSVTLDLAYQPGAVPMQFLYNNTSWSAWEKFAATKAMTLPTGDGLKTVQVRFMDAAGNVSTVYSDSIILDTFPPTGAITINAGAETSGTLAVTLNLSMAGGGAMMQFSADSKTWSAWERFAAARAYSLAGGAGIKTVYVRFQDGAGKVSAVYSDSITYTTAMPLPATAGNIVINRGDKFTTSTSVSLAITNPDPSYASMAVSSNGTSWTVWETVKTAKTLTLPGGDGVKTVYVKFRKASGVVSKVFFSTIVLDTTPPTGTVAINGSAYATVTSGVVLNLTASDINTVVAVQFSGNGTTWQSWETFAATRDFVLPAGDGVKKVYARFMDAAGKISAICSATIVLDTTPPVGTIRINGGAATTTSPIVTATFSATGGAVYMQTSIDDGGWTAWVPYVTKKVVTFSEGNGERSVNVRFRDVSGNVSGIYSGVISLFQ